MDVVLQAVFYRLQADFYRLQADFYRLQAVFYRLQAVGKYAFFSDPFTFIQRLILDSGLFFHS